MSAKAPASETTTLRRGKLSQMQYELFQDRVYTAADWEKQRGYSRIAPALLQCTCLKVLRYKLNHSKFSKFSTLCLKCVTR
jgi:hypothetical protein